ncbi:type II toxin-antitoxin system PemK/MazF family toxin [Spirosoma areae]
MKNKIVLVPFPFDDLTGSKLRPALCLTNTIGTYNHVVVSFITSQVAKANEPSDLQLLTAHPAFKLTGLKVDSSIRFHRLITIPTYLIQRQLGVLPTAYQADLEQKLRLLFELH